MALPNKYKGKTFADISKNIQKNYADRYDAISQRGLMSEMEALRQEQEYQRAKQQIKESLNNILNNPNPQAQPQQQTVPQVNPNNQGVQVQPNTQQPDTSFNHAASQSYNQQFRNGGWIEADEYRPEPLDMSGFDQQFLNNQTLIDASRLNNLNNNQNVGIGGLPQTQISSRGIAPQGNNILRYAPIAGNLFNILTARRPDPIQNNLSKTSVDQGLATRVQPRQTQFSNIDFSPIERGINQQARSFTGNNLNVSGGNAGAFIANELGNQTNVMNAIAQARMQQQQSDQQTQAMNAQEQARIDQFKQAQNSQAANIQAQNIGLEMQMEDLNARDLGAYNTNRSANIGAIFNSLGNIGREQDQMDMIANSLGYNSFGQYVQNLTPRQQQGISEWLRNLLSARRSNS